MKRIKSKSEKRLIVEGTVNGKEAFFLVDTGASVGLMDEDRRREYDLAVGRRYPGTIVGAGGEMYGVRYCNTFAEIEGRMVPQFLLADISDVVRSIRRETGIEVLGIISLPQMKICGFGVDANDMELIVE